MKPLGDSHLIERGNSLKNKCNLCKKTIFLCKIAVALRMECVDLSNMELKEAMLEEYKSHSVWSAWI